MKQFSLALLLVLLSLVVAVPAFAQDEHRCNHDEPTIESLHHCVHHAVEMGHVDQNVARGLLAKLDAAQAAFERSEIGTAANQLGAFINQVEAQSGKKISAQHAGHLVMHAEMMIEALGQ